MIPVEARRLLDFIGDVEAGGDYEAIYGFNQDKLLKPLTHMTIAEVQDAQRHWTRDFGSSASGKYQIMRATLSDLIGQLNLTGRERFDSAMQDRLGYALLSRRGYHDFMAGRISVIEFGKNLAKEWASLPVLADTQGAHRRIKRGMSYYEGDALNKSLVEPESVESVLRNLRDGTSAPPAPKPVKKGEKIMETERKGSWWAVVGFLVVAAIVGVVLWQFVL